MSHYFYPILCSPRQEALQAAISEKDSTLAVLEMTSTKNQKNMEEIDKLIQDKHKLQAQLREVVSCCFFQCLFNTIPIPQSL